MKYKGRIKEGVFLSRPNRFIAYVMVDGREEKCHVKNTGRCRELLVPGCKVYLEESENPNRSTRFDLVATEKKIGDSSILINMDSQAPNSVVEEWLRKGELFGEKIEVKREVTYSDSRFDFSITDESGRITFLEVKGCTLEKNGVVMFPDAPTERGVKHVKELIKAKKEGYGAYILILVQMCGVKYFVPNWDTHPAFGEALREAERNGVVILCYDSIVTSDSITLFKSVPVVLS
ncbi:MAG: DNA/RNA nuclease SfsA [Spirochaetales bacterium]|nr:DNA/RNA nuclease SfsA [Spirochaetales bacterium]